MRAGKFPPVDIDIFRLGGKACERKLKLTRQDKLWAGLQGTQPVRSWPSFR